MAEEAKQWYIAPKDFLYCMTGQKMKPTFQDTKCILTCEEILDPNEARLPIKNKLVTPKF